MFVVHFIEERPGVLRVEFLQLHFQLAHFLVLLPFLFERNHGFVGLFQRLAPAVVAIQEFLHFVDDSSVRAVDALEFRCLHEESVLVLGFAHQKLLGLVLVQDRDWILHLNVPTSVRAHKRTSERAVVDIHKRRNKRNRHCANKRRRSTYRVSSIS